MDYMKKYTEEAIESLEPWLFLLPTDVQRKVKILASLVETHGCATFDEVSAQIGSNNWVISKRTKRIVERYGEDVIAVSKKRCEEAEIRAIESRF